MSAKGSNSRHGYAHSTGRCADDQLPCCPVEVPRSGGPARGRRLRSLRESFPPSSGEQTIRNWGAYPSSSSVGGDGGGDLQAAARRHVYWPDRRRQGRRSGNSRCLLGGIPPSARVLPQALRAQRLDHCRHYPSPRRHELDRGNNPVDPALMEGVEEVPCGFVLDPNQELGSRVVNAAARTIPVD